MQMTVASRIADFSNSAAVSKTKVFISAAVSNTESFKKGF